MNWNVIIETVAKPILICLLSISSYAYGTQVKIDNLQQNVAALSYTSNRIMLRLDGIEQKLKMENLTWNGFGHESKNRVAGIQLVGPSYQLVQ